MSNDNEAVFARLMAKFDVDVMGAVRRESQTGRLSDEGQLRLLLRSNIQQIVQIATIQIDQLNQVKLLFLLATELKDAKELMLASECYDTILTKLNDEPENTKSRVLAIHGVVDCEIKDITSLKQCRIAPMSISKILRCIQRLRKSIEMILQLQTRKQEEYAYLILNSCKMIIDIGQPLVWFNCGKYIIETMMYCALSMESVINLCTARHMQMRMKLYCTAFYGAITQTTIEEARSVLHHTKVQVRELREREELDPPIPDKIGDVLVRAEIDVAVMKCVLSFWSDPDLFDLSSSSLAKFSCPQESDVISSNPTALATLQSRSFTDRCLCECIRVQQLTTGNANEMWKKRSLAIMKAFWTFFEPVELETFCNRLLLDSSDNEDTEIAVAKDNEITIASLAEVATIAMFDDVDGAPSGPVLSRLWDIVDLLAAAGPRCRLSGSSEFDDIQLIRQLSKTIELQNDPESTLIAAELISRIDSLIYTEGVFRRQVLLRRVALGIWKRVIYPQLQLYLSTENSAEAIEFFARNGDTLLTSFRSFEATSYEDPVLVVSMGIICAQVMNVIGDKKKAIAILKKSYESVEEHRSSRVDLRLHAPDDPRDIMALQKASFSSSRNAEDWFHAEKRLGANAYAGFGIFGAGSRTDRTDQALVDLHAEIASLYFRFELEYAILKKSQKGKHVQHLIKVGNDTPGAFPTDLSAVPPPKTASGKPKRISTAESTGKLSTLKGRQPSQMRAVDDIDAEKLICTPGLRSFCCKNNYLLCLLSLELARVDTSADRRAVFLKDAHDAIVEAECREVLLAESFRECSLLTVDSSRAPVVLARSHRAIFVAPVAHVRAHRSTHYYQILAREQGSGTEITLSNDNLAGSERRVFAKDFASVSDCVVRIHPLRPGERYVFACVGYKEDGTVVSDVSPTSAAVEAVNPLSTITLWAVLSQTAAALNEVTVSRSAAARVCRCFFLSAPKPAGKSVGKGLNIFIDEEPLLCMLAIKQASPVVLDNFIRAFITLETPLKRAKVNKGGKAGGENIHWDMRRPKQARIITSIRKAALVTTIASSLHKYEVLIRCVCLGYNLASELLQYDEAQLSYALLPSILAFLCALQAIPKRHWHTLEHTLYSRMTLHALRMGVYSRNVMPVVKLLVSFFPECSDPLFREHKLPEVVKSQYYAVLVSLQMGNGIFVCPSSPTCSTFESGSVVINQLAEVLSVSIDGVPSNFLWKEARTSERALLVRGCVSQLATEDAASLPSHVQQLDKMMKERPVAVSDLLVLLLKMCDELVAQGSSKLVLDLTTRIKVFDKFLAPAAAAANQEWKFKFITVMPSREELEAEAAAAAAAAAAAGAAKKGGGGAAKGKKGAVEAASPAPAPAPTEQDGEDPFTVPARFTTVTADEEAAQLSALARMAAIFARIFFPDMGKCNHFPKLAAGPHLVIDPEREDNIKTCIVDDSFRAAVAAANEGANGFDELPKANGIVPTPAPGKGTSSPRNPLIQETNPFTMDKVDHVKYLSASVTLFSRANQPASAISQAVTLWNFLVENWVDPFTFASEFLILRDLFSTTVFALTTQLEGVTGLHEVNMQENVGATILATENVDLDGENEAVEDDEVQDENETSGPGNKFGRLYPQRRVKELIFLSRDLLIFMVKLLWIYEKRKEVVEVGSRVLAIFMRKAPEFAKPVGEMLIPLTIESQQRIIEKAEDELAARKQELQTFIDDFEEYMKKKRRKKLRIARLEKDEDEIKFEADKEVHDQNVRSAETLVSISKTRLMRLNAEKKKFSSLYPTGLQMLDKVRVTARSLLADCKAELTEDDGGDLRVSVRRSRELGARLDELLEQFNIVAHFLREKKDRLTLIEALKDQGNILLLFGRLDIAKAVWHDAVDGYFNTMDACIHWKKVLAEMDASYDFKYVSGLIPIVVTLGNLSRFCSSSDWEKKSVYSRMAAEICRYPFLESFGHPQTLVGFAAYECRELGGVHSLAFNSEKLSAQEIVTSLDEILDVLTNEGQCLAALPAVVLLEHFAAVYTCNPCKWLAARLRRINILVEGCLFAEAISMISSIMQSISSIERRTYNLPIKSSNVCTDPALFDTSLNGLDFHGLAPFTNHRPVEDSSNKLAVEWISSFPQKFSTFAASYKIVLPKRELSPEERAAMEEKMEAIRAAEEEKKKTKGGKGAKNEPAAATISTPIVDDELSWKPMFEPLQQIDVTITCAKLLISLASVDGRTTVEHSVTLSSCGQAGMGLIDAAADQLSGLAADGESQNMGVLSDAKWIALYGRCQIVKAKHLITIRSLRSARAVASALTQLLQSCRPSAAVAASTRGESAATTTLVVDSISPKADLRYIVAQLWFTVKDLLTDIAARQARFHDVISLTTNTARDSSTFFAEFWLRAALLHRAQAHFKTGNLHEAEVDCNEIISQYERSHCADVGLVRALALKASVLRSRGLMIASKQYSDNVNEILTLLRRSRNLAEELARKKGFHGTDANITFNRGDTAVMSHHLLQSHLHSLTEIHDNVPILSIDTKVDTKVLADLWATSGGNSALAQERLAKCKQIDSKSENQNSKTLNRTFGKELVQPEKIDDGDDGDGSRAFAVPTMGEDWNGRLGPIDSKVDEYSPSEFANIYLREVRCLAIVHAALCSVLNDVRTSSACTGIVNLPDNFSIGTSSTFRGTIPQIVTFSADELLAEQIAVGEEGLKALRHVIYSPPWVRSTLLLSVGCTRMSSMMDKGSDVGDGDSFLHPLRTVLELGVEGTSHPWATMREAAMQLVEILGNQDVQLKMDGSGRMKAAVTYLIAAIKLGVQNATIEHSILGLCGDGAFAAQPSPELSNILDAVSSSSVKTGVPSAGGGGVAVAGGGKGKGMPAAAVATATGLSGRDALLLLLTTARECDPLWGDGPDVDVVSDLHNLIKREFPPYAKNCTMMSIPDPNAELKVSVNSVSTLWSLLKTPSITALPVDSSYADSGLFSHVAVYFLMGTITSLVTPDVSAAPPTKGKGAAVPAPTAEEVGEPVLDKRVLYRPHLDMLEGRVRGLRYKWNDAINKKFYDVALQHVQQLGLTICLLIELLHNGFLSVSQRNVEGDVDSIPLTSRFKIDQTTDNAHILCVNLPSSQECQLTVADGLFERLANLFCFKLDCEFIVDRELCLLLRFAMGHDEK